MIRNLNKSRFLILFFGLVVLLTAACNRNEKARQKLESVKNDPQASEYAVRLAEMDYLTGRHPDKTYAYTLISDFIKEGYFTEARYAIDHILGLYGPDPDMYYLEAVCYRNQHAYNQALASVNKGLSLDNNNRQLVTEKSNIVEEGKNWSQIDSLSALLKSQPNRYGLILERSQKLLGMREFDAAIYDADTVLRADSSNLPARFVKGIAYLLDGKYNQALPEFKILANHDEAPAIEEYKFYYTIAGSLAKNSKQLNDNPLSPGPYINIARTLSRISEFTNALITLDKGLGKIPGNNSLMYAKVLVFMQKGDKASARNLVYQLEAKGFKVDAAVKKAVE